MSFAKPVKTWTVPVNLTKHAAMIAQGFTFVESSWENDFAVSKYIKRGRTVTIESGGNEMQGRSAR